MNKLYIITALIFTSVVYASAEESGIRDQIQNRIMIIRQAVGQDETREIPQVTTGDAKIDIEVKALTKEMESKIKAIREEYLEKIKAVIGERKAVIASTTPYGMMRGEKRGEEQGKKVGRPTTGTSTTEIRGVGRIMGEAREFLPVPRMRNSDTESVQDIGSRIKDFFGGFFGNN